MISTPPVRCADTLPIKGREEGGRQTKTPAWQVARRALRVRSGLLSLRERLLGLVGQLGKSLRFAHGEVGKHFTVKLDAGQFQAVHEA